MLNKYRSLGKKILKPITTYLVNKKINPNILSVLSLLSAIISALFFIKDVLSLAILAIVLNAVLDALDGEVAREQNLEGEKGDFIDHVIDRYSDVFILVGITFSPYSPTWLGVLVISGVLLTSYLGTQAQAVGVGRMYSGIMGRADRLVLLIISTTATMFYSQKIFGFFILGWGFSLLAILSYITLIQRFKYIWKKL